MWRIRVCEGRTVRGPWRDGGRLPPSSPWARRPFANGRRTLRHFENAQAGKIHPEFLRLLWVLADMQTVKYFNFVGDEEDIGNERFKWS